MNQLEEEVAQRQMLEEEVVLISEREQRRIGQDLHDELGQNLAGLALLAKVLASDLEAESHPRAQDASRLNTFLLESINAMRALAGSAYPVELEREGLVFALQDLAQRNESLTKVVCTVTADDNFHFEKSHEIHLYRIAQEAVTNAIKHGRPSEIHIECRSKDGHSILTISDNGIGLSNGVIDQRGMGLHLFKYRARLIGAKLELRDSPQGGSQVFCIIPETSPSSLST